MKWQRHEMVEGGKLEKSISEVEVYRENCSLFKSLQCFCFRRVSK